VGNWRRLHNEELRNLLRFKKYYQGDKVKGNYMGGEYSTHGNDEMHTKFWSESLKEVTLRRSRHRWEDNIKMDLAEMGWEGVNWMHLTQDRDQWRAVVNTVMKTAPWSKCMQLNEMVISIEMLRDFLQCLQSKFGVVP